MSDIDAASLSLAIDELAPNHLKPFLKNALEADNFDFDLNGMILTGEATPERVIIRTSIIKREDSLWLSVVDEVYDFLCTSSAAYKTERSEAGSNAKSIITFVAASLAAKFHIALGVATGFVTLAIIAAFKLTKNAWCTLQASKKSGNDHLPE
ncbi:hypothetical protein [Pseudomonas sp.]|uniref:hypothetical protein n=1 Tax=Pseudomonas sp. TaxID=306 RepID=UPI0028A67579|nr:hypothetical protein [Pseudomonas sp.]